MKSEQIINSIIHKQVCSIDIAKKLTKALHNEGLLKKNLYVRFRPLYRDFDIITTNLDKKAGVQQCFYVGKIENLKNVLNKISSLHLDFYELRDFCITNNFFNAGSNEQYNKLFDLNCNGASTTDLALVIWICSDTKKSAEDIEAMLNDAITKEYMQIDGEDCRMFVLDKNELRELEINHFDLIYSEGVQLKRHPNNDNSFIVKAQAEKAAQIENIVQLMNNNPITLK